MTHTFLTVIAPLSPLRVEEAAGLLDAVGNPASPDLFGGVDADGNGVHFASLHAVTSADGQRAYLVLECSADVTQPQMIARLAAAESWLRPILRLAADWIESADFAGYLTRHVVTVGAGWRDNPGVPFTGTPGFTVGRIRDEARLAERVAGLLGGAETSALERLAQVRQAIAADPSLAFLLAPPPPETPFVKPSALRFGLGLIPPFAATYLWPLGLLVLLWAVGSAVRHGHVAAFGPGLWHGFLAALAVFVLVALIAFVTLLRLEATDVPGEAVVDRATNAAMFARENRVMQNHMISVTQRKPGLVRAFTARLVFWAIGQFVKSYYPPGFLSDIGTIHFARWVTAPNSRDLIFMSNYDGSWESYLEDFITRAHAGLTGVWSNCIGFPRTTLLVQKGATDGERFKRYARHSMRPTRVWLSAYPTLTTTNIRTNALIRRGLAGAMTEDEARDFLALFGSAPRPADTLVENEIQSLILGGLGFLPFGTCLLGTWNFAADGNQAARRWLAGVRPDIAFADGRRIEREAVVTLGLTASGLEKLGLPPDGLASFPFTFLEGMATEARGRILGDIGPNAPVHWRWGVPGPDCVLLVYGRSPAAVAALEAKLCEAAGDVHWHRIPLEEVQKTEPFGFADGLSQPVIRGTHKATLANAIHLMAAGEFVLGYPDNRGNLPPGPVLPAIADPQALLPLSVSADGFARTVAEAPRDLGCNGSFLVIRQLEQDVAAFQAYCAEQAQGLAHSRPFACPVTPAFIGAKLVGRWQDGSPLVRHPFEPAGHTQQRTHAGGTAARKMHGPGRAGHATMDNDFLFGTEDPDALRCPFGAHIRRANPRDSLDPGSAEQVAITNRHRILRVGRRYQPEPGANPGLLFMCLNGDIERQFEFLQQSWIGNTAFEGLVAEADPLLAAGAGFTVPSPQGPVKLGRLPQFVTTRGGAYFFVPGRRLIDFLSSVG